MEPVGRPRNAGAELPRGRVGQRKSCCPGMSSSPARYRAVSVCACTSAGAHGSHGVTMNESVTHSVGKTINITSSYTDTSNSQLLVSKYQSPTERTKRPWRPGTAKYKMSPEHIVVPETKELFR